MKLPDGVRRHHLLFTKNTWNSQQPTMRLRQEPSLIVAMYDEPHQALHDEISTVPVLCHRSAQIVQQRFRHHDDHFKAIDGLLRLIDETTRSYRAGEIERELGQVVINAISLQLPYIREGQY